jgi:hypothetical protein
MSRVPTRDTIPLVKVPVRSGRPSGAGSRASFRMRMSVSSLCATSPCAACRISSQRRPHPFGFPFDESPLRGGGEWDPDVALQTLQPFKGHVRQRGAGRSTRACSVFFSFWPSDALNGAPKPSSMIWSSSARSTPILGEDCFITDSGTGGNAARAANRGFP